MKTSGDSALHAVSLCFISFIVFIQYDFWESPIFLDRAYLIYPAQSLLRGEPIYSSSFYPYPPLGALASAGAMWIGRCFDIPTYLAPRFAGLLVGIVNPALIYFLTRVATGSAGAGILAGLVLAAFGVYGNLSVTSLEPKVLVVSFSLLAGIALQRRRFGAAGFGAGLAGMCWQPAVVVAFATAVITWNATRGERARAAGHYVIGIGLAVAPLVLYISTWESWFDFWQRSIVIPFNVDMTGSNKDPFFWITTVLSKRFSTEIGFFLAAGLGLSWFAIESMRAGRISAAAAWLGSQSGAIPLLALIWMALNTLDFQGAPDMLTILPCVGFYVGWLVHRVLGAESLRRFRNPGFYAAFILVGSYGMADAVLFEPVDTLSSQRSKIRQILGPEGENRVVSFDAESVYVIGEREAPLPYLRMNRFFVPFASLVEPEGCSGIIRRTLSLDPDVVVARIFKRQSECILALLEQFRLLGYSPRRISFRYPFHDAFTPREREKKLVDWLVYERPGS